MSTKNVQTSTNQFDPTSMGTFQGFQPMINRNLTDFANDPMKSSFFNTQLQMAQGQNQSAFNTRNDQFLQNLRAGGNVGNMPAYAQSELNSNMRGLSAANSNSFNNLLLGANQLRFGATSQMQGYRPLQTGQTQTQQQSGLGTWLPQVLGAGLGIAGAAMGGPAGAALGSSFFGGANRGPTNSFNNIPTDPSAPDMGGSPSWMTWNPGNFGGSTGPSAPPQGWN